MTHVPLKDPRADFFDTLVDQNNHHHHGEWHFEHVGFGTHVYIDAQTGDVMPVTSVVRACRERPRPVPLLPSA